MNIQKISKKIYFFEIRNSINEKQYGYIFYRKKIAEKWVVKIIIKTEFSIYMETIKRFKTLKECKSFLKTSHMILEKKQQQ